ncbi:MAG: hypothetical protein WCP17_02055 [bacterium]
MEGLPKTKLELEMEKTKHDNNARLKAQTEDLEKAAKANNAPENTTIEKPQG